MLLHQLFAIYDSPQNLLSYVSVHLIITLFLVFHFSRFSI